VTSGGGGAVACSDSGVVERIGHLISTGRIGPAYDHDVVAYNFRMTNVEAAIGVAQLERLPEFLARKREIFDQYARLADRHPNLSAFPTPTEGRSAHWFSGVTYTGDSSTAGEEFRTFMTARDIDVRPFWKPVHLQVPYQDAISTSMKVTESVWDRIHPLPCSTGITAAELDFVVSCAGEFWERHG
jgi:perosamine synthetase